MEYWEGGLAQGGPSVNDTNHCYYFIGSTVTIQQVAADSILLFNPITYLPTIVICKPQRCYLYDRMLSTMIKIG